jgi:hypothetical protein
MAVEMTVMGISGEVTTRALNLYALITAFISEKVIKTRYIA